MHLREQRSFAPPPPQPREHWTRPDVPRPAAAVQTFLPSPDPIVPDLDESEALDAADLFGLLPRAAQVDLVRGAL